MDPLEEEGEGDFDERGGGGVSGGGSGRRTPGGGGGGGGNPFVVAGSVGGGNHLMTREVELQKLLAEERLRSEQRKRNYQALRGEHLKVQRDYLQLQAEVKQVLEETRLIRESKDLELDSLKRELESKENANQRLKRDWEARDPALLRDQLVLELRGPLADLERDKQSWNLEREKMAAEIKLLTQRVEMVDRERADSNEKTKLFYEAEISGVRREKEELARKLLEAQSVPEIQKFLALSQENANLVLKLNGFKSELATMEAEYRKLEGRLAGAVESAGRREEVHGRAVQDLQRQADELKDEAAVLRAQLKVKNRERETIAAELAAAKRELADKRKALDESNLELTAERDSLKVQLKAVKQQLASEREQLAGLNDKWEKRLAAAEKSAKAGRDDDQLIISRAIAELDSARTKLSETKSELAATQQELTALKKSVESVALSRLDLEREIMTLKVRLESASMAEEALAKLKRQHAALHDEMSRGREELADSSATGRDLSRQRDRLSDEVTRLRTDLSELEQTCAELKANSEKHLTRLRLAHEDDRQVWSTKISDLETALMKRSLEADHLRKELSLLTANSSKYFSTGGGYHRSSRHAEGLGGGGLGPVGLAGAVPPPGMVPGESYQQLMKQYRDLKRATLSSLLNCNLINNCDNHQQTQNPSTSPNQKHKHTKNCPSHQSQNQNQRKKSSDDQITPTAN